METPSRWPEPRRGCFNESHRQVTQRKATSPIRTCTGSRNDRSGWPKKPRPDACTEFPETLRRCFPCHWRQPPPKLRWPDTTSNVLGQWEIPYGLTRLRAARQRFGHGDAEAAVRYLRAGEALIHLRGTRTDDQAVRVDGPAGPSGSCLRPPRQGRSPAPGGRVPRTSTRAGAAPHARAGCAGLGRRGGRCPASGGSDECAASMPGTCTARRDRNREEPA